MSGERGEWARFAIEVAIGIGWSVFDRWAQLQPAFEAWLPWVSPIAYMAVGAAVGFTVCRILDNRRMSEKVSELERSASEKVCELERRIESKDLAIEGLKKEAAGGARASVDLEVTKALLDMERERSRKLDVLLRLTKRERFCVAKVLEIVGDSGRVFSVSDPRVEPVLGNLAAQDGIVTHVEKPEDSALKGEGYGISREWAEVLESHRSYFSRVTEREAGF